MIVPIILGIVTLGGALTRKKTPKVPEVPVLSTKEIMEARALPELNTYYDQLNLLFKTRQLEKGEYMLRYNAYTTRFYELVGGAE